LCTHHRAPCRRWCRTRQLERNRGHPRRRADERPGELCGRRGTAWNQLTPPRGTLVQPAGLPDWLLEGGILPAVTERLSSRRTEYYMKCLALAAAGAAVIGLTACSQTAAPATHGTVTPVAPVSCSRQYSTWDHGQGKGLIAALNAVSSADTAGDIHVLTATLAKARPAVARAAHYPMPACADPRGYWSVLLMHVNAAAASPGSASSVLAAMKDVPKIEHELIAELSGTTR